MNTIRFVVVSAPIAALLTLAGPASAQANRTFVSGHGSDSNPCSLSAPCRSFAQALGQTNAGGEITILDPAGYGSVTINKAVSIINDGVGEAGVTASAADAIDINIGVSDVVNLRGLTLVGGGGFAVGIFFNNLGTLNIQNCVIRGFVNPGILLEPAGTAQFNVSDTIVSNIVGSSAIRVRPTGSGTVTGVFNRVQAIGAVAPGFDISGALATGTVDVTIADSTVSNNSQVGISASSLGGQAVTNVMVVNSVVANNGTAISEDGANSTTYLTKNRISGNTTAFSVTNFGQLFSFGDNDIKGNGNDGGAIPLVATK